MKCLTTMSQVKNKNCKTNLAVNNSAIANLQCIPSIGPKVGKMLVEIGISKVTDLKNRSPEKLYKQVCEFREEILDRCVLYHFRCAVYFATNEHHKPELLKWWSWKDE